METSAIDESALYLLDLVDSVQGIAITNMNLSTENRDEFVKIGLLGKLILSTVLIGYYDCLGTRP